MSAGSSNCRNSLKLDSLSKEISIILQWAAWQVRGLNSTVVCTDTLSWLSDFTFLINSSRLNWLSYCSDVVTTEASWSPGKWSHRWVLTPSMTYTIHFAKYNTITKMQTTWQSHQLHMLTLRSPQTQETKSSINKMISFKAKDHISQISSGISWRKKCQKMDQRI